MFHPRFSVKVLLFTIALLCLWLGWNAYVVRSRSELRHSLSKNNCTVVPWRDIDQWKASGGNFKFAPDAEVLLSRKILDGPMFLPTSRSQNVSYIRRLMGDEPIFAIWVDRETDTRPYRKAFPEARVVAASR